MGEAVNCDIFTRAAADADLSIIEGMRGLFDGSSPVNKIGRTAESAKPFDVPVLLVIDGSAMARSLGSRVRFTRLYFRLTGPASLRYVPRSITNIASRMPARA